MLRPGGIFLFIEHVLSPTTSALRIPSAFPPLDGLLGVPDPSPNPSPNQVLSPTDGFLAQQQRTLTPLQVMSDS